MKKIVLIAIFLSFFCFVNLTWSDEINKETIRLAESGNAEAQFRLGFFYFAGIGVTLNYAKAIKWFTKTAEQGYVDAQDGLGFIFYKGKGVPKNFTKAYVWWSIAFANGGEDSRENLELISSIMTPQQIAQAQKEAAELWKRINKSKK